MNQSVKQYLSIIAAVVILGGFYFYGGRDLRTTSSQSSPSPGEGEIQEWKTYRNEELGFEFMYPGYFFTQGNFSGRRELIVLSNDAKFEDKEAAIVISLYVDTERAVTIYSSIKI